MPTLVALCLAGAVACKGEPPVASSGSEREPAPAPSVTPPPSGGAPAAPPGAIGPVRPKPVVGFEPAETTTDWQGTLKIVVASNGFSVGEGLLNDLASRVSIRTWPELTEVATTRETQDAPGPVPEGSLWAYVHVRPVVPLQPRWYVLAITGVPAELQWHHNPTHQTLADGSQATRFRVGSEPVVSRIDVCPTSRGSWWVAVHFSERLTGATPETSVGIAQPNGPATGCRFLTGNDSPFPEVDFDCSTVDLGLPLEISIQPGFQSPSGVALRGVGGSTSPRFTFTAASLRDIGDGCRYFRP